MRYIDNLVGKGLSWWIISQLIMLNMAWMITLAGPMAMLVASLMAFGTLSSTNEIIAIRTAGVSQIKMMMPVLIIAGILCYLLILFNNKVLPEANHRTKILMADIQRTRPTFVIEPGKFTDDISGFNMLVNKTIPESNKLEGITIIDNSNPTGTNILTAENGGINFSKDNSKLIIELFRGEIHRLNKQNYTEDYRKVNFDKHIVTIDAQGFGFSKSDERAFTRGDRELSSDSMRSIVKNISVTYEKDNESLLKNIQNLAKDFAGMNYGIDKNTSDTILLNQTKSKIDVLTNLYRSYKSQVNGLKVKKQNNQRQIDTYLVEIYKKYSIPFACIVFVLIGAPLGVITKRGSFGMAAGMSLGFFLLYWAFLIGGEKLADREMLSPLLSMWSANIILGVIGLYLTFRNRISFKKLFNQ